MSSHDAGNPTSAKPSRSTRFQEDLSPAQLARRRAIQKYAALGSGAAMASLLPVGGADAAARAREEEAQARVDRAMRGMPIARIKDIGIITYPAGGFGNYHIVKVTTDQAGLYGYGEATIEGRTPMLREAVEYLKPAFIGKPADRIEQLWRLGWLGPYYKNDQVQNSAVSGICDALWDIKGRQVGLPVYELVGGKAREACQYYGGAGWNDNDNPGKGIVESAKQGYARGIRIFRVSVFMRQGEVKGLDGGMAYDRDLGIRRLLTAFEAFSRDMPADARLACDVHSMFDPPRALRFCKEVEKFNMFFVEDPIPPEQQEFLRVIRQQSHTPIAIGEVYDNPLEWKPVVEERLIDFLRIHSAHIGGFTATRKVAVLCENFEVGTAFHAASTSPVGHMANLTVDITSNGFGIVEGMEYSDELREIFPGAMEFKDGFVYVSEKPGWGIEINETAAAKVKLSPEGPRSNHLRDGTEIMGGR